MDITNICQITPELRVALIAINREGKILLQESYRWPGLLTVPGKGVIHGDTIEKTVMDIIIEEKLELVPNSTPQHIGYLEVINPKQFYKPKSHMHFEEFVARVLNLGKNYHKLYQILHEKEIVEEYTYQVLSHYANFLSKNNHPK